LNFVDTSSLFDLTALGASFALSLGWLRASSHKLFVAAGELTGLAPSLLDCSSTGLFLKLTKCRSLLDLKALGVSFTLALSRQFFEAAGELEGLASSQPV